MRPVEYAIRRRGCEAGVRRGAAGLAALTLLTLLSPGRAGSASAATATEERAGLMATYVAAGDAYRASRDLRDGLPRHHQLATKAATAAGTASIKAVGEVIDAARTPEDFRVARDALAVESLRARTVLDATRNLADLHRLRVEQVSIVTGALADWTAGRIPHRGYRRATERAAAFTTLLAQDTVTQLGALGRPVVTPALVAPQWRAGLSAPDGAIPTAAGWVGFAGGCALPAAPAAWRPALPAFGPGVATNAALVDESRRRARSLADVGRLHRQLLRSAATESTLSHDAATPWVWFPARAARLGYAGLSGEDPNARTVLRADARALLTAGPEAMNSLHASHVLLAAAAAADWTDLEGLDETVLVRWLGPQTCMHADEENFVKDPTNIAAVHNAATFAGAAVFLDAHPEQAAALARQSLTSIGPALDAITEDGGSYEGPGYWSYQSRAVATLYATLPNAYARPPLVLPSLRRVSHFALNSSAPDGIPITVADSFTAELSPLMPAWDAHVRRDAAVGAWVHERRVTKPDAYLMWWWTPPGARPARVSAVYPRTGLAVLHRAASTATLKAGRNDTGHAHLDLGTFSLHRRGIQWAVDPGLGDYDAPGYFSAGRRWDYWKPSTAAHSTLAVTQQNQPAEASAAFTATSAASASVDLRAALPGTTSASRTLLHGATTTVVRDVVTAATPVALTWTWVTDAAVTVGTDRAVLRRDGQELTVRLDGVPAGSTLLAVPAPETGPHEQALTVLTLSMPPVTSLVLTATAY